MSSGKHIIDLSNGYVREPLSINDNCERVLLYIWVDACHDKVMLNMLRIASNSFKRKIGFTFALRIFPLYTYKPQSVSLFTLSRWPVYGYRGQTDRYCLKCQNEWSAIPIFRRNCNSHLSVISPDWQLCFPWKIARIIFCFSHHQFE